MKCGRRLLTRCDARAAFEVSELSVSRQPASGGVSRSIHEADSKEGRSGRSIRGPQASLFDEHSRKDHNGDLGSDC